jgi:hypothetical protein
MNTNYSQQGQNYYFNDSSSDLSNNNNSGEDFNEPKRFEPQQPRIRIFNKFQPSLTAQPRRSALKNRSQNRIQNGGQQSSNNSNSGGGGGGGGNSSRNKLKNVLFKTMPYKSLFSDLSTVYEEADDLFWANNASQYLLSSAISPNSLLSLSQVMKSSQIDFGDKSNVNSATGSSSTSQQQQPINSRRAIEIITPMRASTANMSSLNSYLQNVLSNSSSINNMLINNNNNSNNNISNSANNNDSPSNNHNQSRSSNKAGKY